MRYIIIWIATTALYVSLVGGAAFMFDNMDIWTFVFVIFALAGQSLLIAGWIWIKFFDNGEN